MQEKTLYVKASHYQRASRHILWQSASSITALWGGDGRDHHLEEEHRQQTNLDNLFKVQKLSFNCLNSAILHNFIFIMYRDIPIWNEEFQLKVNCYQTNLITLFTISISALSERCWLGERTLKLLETSLKEMVMLKEESFKHRGASTCQRQRKSPSWTTRPLWIETSRWRVIVPCSAMSKVKKAKTQVKAIRKSMEEMEEKQLKWWKKYEIEK